MILDLFGKTSLCQVVVRKKSKPRQARKKNYYYSCFMLSKAELAEALAGPGNQRAQIEQPDPLFLSEAIVPESEGGHFLRPDGTISPPVDNHPSGKVLIFRRSEGQARYSRGQNVPNPNSVK